jgi:hypothetical protein
MLHWSPFLRTSQQKLTKNFDIHGTTNEKCGLGFEQHPYRVSTAQGIIQMLMLKVTKTRTEEIRDGIFLGNIARGDHYRHHPNENWCQYFQKQKCYSSGNENFNLYYLKYSSDKTECLHRSVCCKLKTAIPKS